MKQLGLSPAILIELLLVVWLTVRGGKLIALETKVGRIKTELRANFVLYILKLVLLHD